jgi:hypothetical protein
MKRIIDIEMDRTRHLKYGMNTMIEVEKQLGKPLTTLASESFKLGDLRTLLYLGLKWEDNTLNPDTVGDLMDISIEKNGMQYISDKLGQAIQGAFGQMGANAIPS